MCMTLSNSVWISNYSMQQHFRFCRSQFCGGDDRSYRYSVRGHGWTGHSAVSIRSGCLPRKSDFNQRNMQFRVMLNERDFLQLYIVYLRSFLISNSLYSTSTLWCNNGAVRHRNAVVTDLCVPLIANRCPIKDHWSWWSSWRCSKASLAWRWDCSSRLCATMNWAQYRCHSALSTPNMLLSG